MSGEQRGFTLVELMMVVACLAVLAVIAVPRWVATGQSAYRLKNAALQVASDIRLARVRAIATNRQFRLRFDPLSDTYLLEKGESASGSVSWVAEGTLRHFGPDGASSFRGVQITGEEEYAVIFRPNGGVTAVTIILQNTRAQTMKVVCSMAGRIRVVRE